MHLIERAPSWFSPEDTVWLGLDSQDREKKDAYRKQVASGATHLAREVRFEAPPRWFPPQTVGGVRNLTKLTDQEFGRLRSFGMQVPPTEWYVRRTFRNGLQLIAHVAVVEGVEIDDFSREGNHRPYRECTQRISAYEDMHWPHLRYLDAEQCMWGYLRTEAASDLYGAQPKDDFFMVDIEPRF